MCRCGGIIRDVLTSQRRHDAYAESLDCDINREKTCPNPIINNIAKDKEYKSSDIGDLPGGGFPHTVYHFTVDLETFETKNVKFASPHVSKILGHLLLK